MMTIEIWSDVVCPFCYIGKRRFEKALAQFPQQDQVSVSWRSFELDPNAKKDYGFGIHELLASKYGKSVEWARQMNSNLQQQATELGLAFDFDKVIPTNSFDAHRLLQLAKKQGLQNEMQEKLFSAYFIEGKNISSHKALTTAATQTGLDLQKVEALLKGTDLTMDVRADEAEAQALGLTGVPAFVIDKKYLISGAQPAEVFLQALQESWRESHQ